MLDGFKNSQGILLSIVLCEWNGVEYISKEDVASEMAVSHVRQSAWEKKIWNDIDTIKKLDAKTHK